MARKRNRKELPSANLPMNRRETGVSPATLTETSQLATFRIVATALLFAVLAFWGLAKIRRFSEEFILRRELASFRSVVNKAQVFAVQKKQTVRLLLSELENKNICRFEKLAKNSQRYFDVPLSREDHDFGIDSRNWSSLEPEQHSVFSAVDVSVGPLHTVYMFPNNTWQCNKNENISGKIQTRRSCRRSCFCRCRADDHQLKPGKRAPSSPPIPNFGIR